MAVKAEQLPSLLSRSLSPVYLLAGAEPLLLQECRDQVIAAAHAEGFLERDVFTVERGFDWELPAQASAALSLFSSRKIMDIRIPGGKPGTNGARKLTELAEQPDPDVLLLVSCGKWDAASRKSKWAGTLAKSGVMVEVWPVKPHELPGWIQKRMRAAGLEPEADAVSLLAELSEGNLLAAQQEIEKLLLLSGEKRITAERLEQAVANSARFDAFRLVECALLGQLGESLRVASGLLNTNVPIQAVAGAIYRELSLLDAVRAATSAGEDGNSVFRRLRIWPARQAPMRQALRRLSGDNLGQAFRSLSLIDLQGKGQAPGDPWQTLDRMLWSLCEPASAPGP
jgi:DNA polymerase-3 subunit delta